MATGVFRSRPYIQRHKPFVPSAPQTGGEITGGLDITLEAISVSSNGVVAVNGALTKTLESIGLLSDGEVDVKGSLDKSLDGISISAAGVVGATIILTAEQVGLLIHLEWIE